MLLIAFTTPAPIQAQDGRVFRVSGDWRLASQRSRLVESGQPLTMADTLIAPVSPRPGERIAMWFERGRVACTVERGARIVCVGARDSACADTTATGGIAQLAIASCLTGEDRSEASAFLTSVLRIFGEDPKRYVPLLSRSGGIIIEEAVLLAGPRALALHDMIPEFPAGQYRMCLSLISAATGTPDETCDDVYWNGEEGRFSPVDTDGRPHRFVPGLYELNVIGATTAASAWLLLAEAGEYEEARAAFAGAKRNAESWRGADRLEVRTALRAWLMQRTAR
jgi:hypothetical protein